MKKIIYIEFDLNFYHLLDEDLKRWILPDKDIDFYINNRIEERLLQIDERWYKEVNELRNQIKKLVFDTNEVSELLNLSDKIMNLYENELKWFKGMFLRNYKIQKLVDEFYIKKKRFVNRLF